MTFVTLAIVLLIPTAILGLAIAARVTTGATAIVLKSLATVATLPVLAFLLFGFLASFEGTDAYFWAFRVLYVALFLFVSATIVFAWLPIKRVSGKGEAQEIASGPQH